MTGPPGLDRAAGCGSNDPNVNSGGIYDSKYSRQEYWIPGSTSPEITIPVAIHIFQDDLGQGTFTDVPATHATLAQVMYWANQMFQDGGASSDPQAWQTFTTDCKINFVLDDRIYFYAGTGLQTSCDLDAKIDYVHNNYPERMQYLGIYSKLPDSPLNGVCGQFARMPYPNWNPDYCTTANGIDGHNGVHLNLGINEWNQFSNAVTLAHELAHCLDLNHLYDSNCRESCDTGFRDYLFDVFGLTPPPPPPPTSCLFNSCSGAPDPWTPGNSVTNNIMNGCGLAYPDWYWITDLQAGRMQRALRVKSVKDYALDAHSTTPLTVATDEVWDFEMRAYQDVVVETGATLTLKCILEMPTAGKIIVKPGARLIIDGGKITTARYSQTFWRGIEVWGSNAHNQFPISQPTYQGMLVLKNGATIEHAREAITVQQPGVWNTFGGVVQATDANFINCRRSAEFLAYQNTSPGGHPIPNRSFFKRCHFYVDDEYRGVDDFYAHVSLWAVDGITFTACTFENLQTTITESAKLGQGIHSLDAGYRVVGECTTTPPWPGGVCPNYTPTTLRGLDHGIDAYTTTTTRAFIVDHCLFEDNICGVYAEGVVGFQAKNSQFKVGGNDVSVLSGVTDEEFSDRHRAIFSTGGWAFAIDDNELEQDGPHTGTEGIVVGYSFDHNDVVFRNQATGLERAYIGEGICADLASGYTAVRGLWFLCNENDNNATDFWARKVTNAPFAEQSDHTIRLNQGSPTRPADNTFDEWPDGSATNWDFKVTTSHAPMTYRHRNVSPYVPINYSDGAYGIVPYPASYVPTDNCAGKLQLTVPPDPDYPSGMAPGPVVNYLLSEKLAYGNTRYLYEQLIDDGNTDEVVQEIQESWPQDAWALHDYLMSKSPYLSVTSLKNMVLQAIMPDAMVTEVLVANPEATRSDGFLTWLQEESGHPLPDYMLGMVVASWDQRTYRDALEGEMAFHHGETTQAANMLIHHWLTLPLVDDDTTHIPMDSVLWAWQQVRTPSARYAEAFTWMQMGDYAQATTVITDMPAEHDLKAPAEQERQRMLALIDLLADVRGSGRTVMQLDSTEVASLQAMMGDAYDRPAIRISNLLCFGYGQCRPPLTGGTEDGDPKALPYTPLPADGAIAQAVLSLHPNPASTWVAIDYDLLTEPTDAVLVVRDLTGREVFRKALHQHRQQVVWDTRHAAPGSYTVVLLNNGRQLRAEKLVIRP